MTLRLALSLTFAAIVLGSHLWVRPLNVQPLLPELPSMRPGCVGDLTVGWLDCMYVFDNGTFLHSRSY